MKNWKTTLFGSLAALGMFFKSNANPIVSTVGDAVSYISMLLLGIHSTDSTNTKS